MTTDQLATIWKTILRDIEPALSPGVFGTWFKHSQLLSVSPQGAELGVENSFAQNAIRKYAEERLIAHLSRELGYPITRVTYTIVEKIARGKKSQTQEGSLFEGEQSPTQNSVPVRELMANERPIASNLNPKYTFETFIVGNRNRLAYAAARAVAERPGTAYNPLYLYGGVGLGKTHLMQAVGNEIMRYEPQKRILYVSCESFTNEFVSAVQKGKAEDFKKRYRTIDVFLVDDIQFIGGKEGTQEEFFHTFNALYQANKQIIITSDKVPSDIKGLEARLSSRFAAGMIADMQLPDLETRQAILLSKCQERGLNLTDEVILYIADRVETNIRELEGALMTVSMRMQAGDVPYSTEGARTALSSYVTTTAPLRKTSLETLVALVCEYYNVTHEELRGPRRQRELVKPRQIVMYLMKHELGMTFPRIGKELGGRDHTTAMHSVEKVEKDMRKNPEILEELKRIKELYYVSSR